MPVAKGPSVTLRSAIVVGLSGIIAAALLVGFVMWASNAGEGFNLGDDEFNAGGTRPIGQEIADNGPILYQNPDGGGPTRPIWLSGCAIAWIRVERSDSCTAFCNERK